ncbi:MAG: hypothetical protein QMB63_07685 [Clostridiaceae bacterium]
MAKDVKSKKHIWIAIIVLLLMTAPLHFKVVTSNIQTDNTGKIDVKYIDGYITIKDDSSEVPAYTSLKDIGKWDFNKAKADTKPILKRVCIAPFVRLSNLDKSTINEFRGYISKFIVECDQDKLSFSNRI